MKEKAIGKKLGLFYVALMYIFAIGVGYASCFYLENLYLRLAVFDLVTTLIIWLFTVIFKNTSIYDPYWSFIPMIMVTYVFFIVGKYNYMSIIFLIVFNIWGLRLTINWIITYTDFSYEDWRYRKYRETCSPFLFQVINFVGLIYVPTIVVYAGMLPIFDLFMAEPSPMFTFGLVIMIFGIMLEFVADRQVHKYIRDNVYSTERKTCSIGLWHYSRHPNYLGEISIWVGAYVSMIAVTQVHYWFFIGMIGMILLFNFISIPMMEKHNKERRKDYPTYISKTSRLLLLPNKHNKEK